MSEGLNMVTLMGHLGADPELTQTSGGPLLKMRLATTEVYFDKEKNKQERTEWHNLKLWGRRAEPLSKILTKGSRIFILGRIETSSYEKDGQKRYYTDIVLTDLTIVGGHTNGQSNGSPRPKAPPSVPVADLPF